MSEESTLLAHCADEVTLAIEDQHFAIGTEDEHEACELGDDALRDLLLDVDSLLELEGALGHLPDLDAGAFDGQELDRVRQVDLRQLGVLVAMGDNLAHLPGGCIVHWICHSCRLGLVLKHADSKTCLLQIEVIMADQSNGLRPVEVPY